MSIKKILKDLLEDKEVKEEDLVEEIKRALNGELNEVEISSLLTLISYKRLLYSSSLLSKCVELVLSLSIQIERPSNKEIEDLENVMVDIVGTGGDGFNTFNVSTASALVAAACGCKVSKHGNRSSTSLSGSADFLEILLNTKLDKLEDKELYNNLEKYGFCFIFAPNYHPKLKYISPIRKKLPFPTLFNFIGPLCNPMKPKRAIIGVFDYKMGYSIARTLINLGVNNGMISPMGSTNIWIIRDSNIEEVKINPNDFGLDEFDIKEVSGGNAKDNADLFLEIIKLKNRPSDKRLNFLLDFILINVAPVLIVSDVAKDFKSAVSIVLDNIFNGNVLNLINSLKN